MGRFRLFSVPASELAPQQAGELAELSIQIRRFRFVQAWQHPFRASGLPEGFDAVSCAATLSSSSKVILFQLRLSNFTPKSNARLHNWLPC